MEFPAIVQVDNTLMERLMEGYDGTRKHGILSLMRNDGKLRNYIKNQVMYCNVPVMYTNNATEKTRNFMS